MISAANTTAYFLLTDCFKAEETLLDPGIITIRGRPVNGRVSSLLDAAVSAPKAVDSNYRRRSIPILHPFCPSNRYLQLWHVQQHTFGQADRAAALFIYHILGSSASCQHLPSDCLILHAHIHAHAHVLVLGDITKLLNRFTNMRASAVLALQS